MICVAKSHFQQLSNEYQIDPTSMGNTGSATTDLHIPENSAKPDMCN